MSEFKRTRGSDGVRKRAKREVLMEKKKKKSYEECEEIREMKRMQKKKKRLITVRKNEMAGTHLMAKLRVV